MTETPMFDSSSFMLDDYAFSNPALVGFSLLAVSTGFKERQTGTDRPLPLPWAMFATGLLCPKESRQHLPQTAHANLTNMLAKKLTHEWILESPRIIRDWARPTWAGLRYGISNNFLEFRDGGILPTREKPLLADESLILNEIWNRGRVLGKVLAKEPNDQAIATALGLEFSL